MTEPRGTLKPEQVAQLLEAVRPNRVRQNRGKDHMEGYDIRAHLTRIFGFGRWDLDGPPAQLIAEESIRRAKDKDNGWPDIRWEVVYRQVVTLTVYDEAGLLVGRYRGEATGKAENQPSRGDAHDGAMKEAETQALKRAAINLGDQFGLGLYNKAARNRDGSIKAVVKRTLVGMPETAVAQSVDHDAPDVAPEADEPEVEADTPAAPARPADARSAAAAGSGPMASALQQVVEQADREDAPRREALVAAAKEALDVNEAEVVTQAHLDTLAGEKGKLSKDAVAAVGAWCKSVGIDARPSVQHKLTVDQWNRLMKAIKAQQKVAGIPGANHRPSAPSETRPPATQEAVAAKRQQLRAELIGRMELLGPDFQEAMLSDIAEAEGPTGVTWQEAMQQCPPAWDAWLDQAVKGYEELAEAPFEEPESEGVPESSSATVAESF